MEIAVKGLHSAAISEQAGLVVAGSIHHGGSLWRIADFERLFNWNHKAEEYSTLIASDFSDDENWALTADPHTMVLWNTQSGVGERYWTAPAEILDVELNSNASLALLALEDHTAVIFDIRRGGIRRVFHHKNRVRSVDFSADNRLVITGSEDYSAKVWDANSGKELASMTHEDDVQLVVLSDDGELAFSMSKYDKALLWKSQNGEKIAEIPLRAEHIKRGIRFTSARFSRDNQFLLTGRPDQIVQLWQLDPMKEVARWKLPKRDSWTPTSSAVIDIAFTENKNRYVAIGSNGFIHTLERGEN